jgi:hypothetical protein
MTRITSDCERMVPWPGRPDDAMECGAPAFPGSEPPVCVEHLLGDMLHKVAAYQRGVDAAREVWPKRAEGRTIVELIAEANQVLAILEAGGRDAVRTRGYRDTLETYRTTVITMTKEAQG